MTPEQVRSLAVDHRADILAFGAVLYEMATGRRAFQGETAADTMTAILTKEPPALEAETPSIPPGLERILQGDPAARARVLLRVLLVRGPALPVGVQQ